MIHLSVGAASHVGRQRTQNQDCAFVSEYVVALADGMGGPPAGDVASLVAVEALRDAMANPDITTLAEALEWANSQVWERAAAREYRGMGTTLCAMALVSDGSDGEPPALALANVGDSRIYLLRGGELELRTEDHSLVEEMVREGRLTVEEAMVHGQRNIVTRAIGIAPTVEVDVWETEPEEGDRYLLCSDGLFNEVSEARIAATLRNYRDPTETAHQLVDLANQAGGRDNITCIVVDVVDGPPTRSGFGDTDERVIVPLPDTVGDLAGFRAAAPHGTAVGGDEEVGRDLGRSMLPPDDHTDEPRARLVTWRTAVFLLAFIGVFAVAAGAVAWYGRSGYFVGVDADSEIAVFQGRPGGLLWFDPTLVESTGVDIDELTPVLRNSVESQPEFASFDEARRYLANLAEQLERTRPTTTTTTRPTTTTTTADIGQTTTTARAP
jgi:PPM family protein phosphatase